MEKNVGLMTLNSQMYNYGGILQEYALQKAIELLTPRCQIIDYNVSTELTTFSIKRSIQNISFDKISNRIMSRFSSDRVMVSVDVSDKVEERRKRFDIFRNDFLCLSNRYVYPQLTEVELDYDILICGSDQIWNPDYNIPSFFMGFGKAKVVRAVYAASIGKSVLTKYQKKVYSRYLKNIDYVSVREESAREMMQPYCEKSIYNVLDPTLLLDVAEWKQLAEISDLQYSEYIFCYFLENTKEKIEEATNFAKKAGKRIIVIPYLHDAYEECYEYFGDIKLSSVGPSDFLSLIKNADFVITDSFHATVFSLIFGRTFYVFNRKSGNYNMNTRIENLLLMINSEDRLIVSEDLRKIDPVQRVIHNFEVEIQPYKKYSVEFLKMVIYSE